MVNKSIKKVYKIICVLIICLIVFSIRENNEIKEFGVQNESVNKSVNLKSMAVLVKDFANQEQEKIRQEQEKLRQEEEKRRAEEAKRRAEEEKKALEQQKPNVGAVKTLSGKLTAYVANCPGCSGRLGCNGQNVSNGTTTYQDSTFGVVNIVASSSNLPCGSIVRFTLPVK